MSARLATGASSRRIGAKGHGACASSPRARITARTVMAEQRAGRPSPDGRRRSCVRNSARRRRQLGQRERRPLAELLVEPVLESPVVPCGTAAPPLPHPHRQEFPLHLAVEWLHPGEPLEVAGGHLGIVLAQLAQRAQRLLDQGTQALALEQRPFGVWLVLEEVAA